MENMNPFVKIWVWLLIFSVIGFIAAFVGSEFRSQSASGEIVTPGWIWIVFIISIILFVIAFILYCLDIAAYQKRMEIAEACGELLPKKKMTCPKPKCTEKKFIDTGIKHCKEITIVDSGIKHCKDIPNIKSETKQCKDIPIIKSEIKQCKDIPNIKTEIKQCDEEIDIEYDTYIETPKSIVITPVPEAFSAAGLIPLTTLSPSSLQI